jgi:hypothetical protein
MAMDPLDRISRIVDDGEDLPLTRIAAVLGLDKEIDRLSEENAKLRNLNSSLEARLRLARSVCSEAVPVLKDGCENVRNLIGRMEAIAR